MYNSEFAKCRPIFHRKLFCYNSSQLIQRHLKGSAADVVECINSFFWYLFCAIKGKLEQRAVWKPLMAWVFNMPAYFIQQPAVVPEVYGTVAASIGHFHVDINHSIRSFYEDIRTTISNKAPSAVHIGGIQSLQCLIPITKLTFHHLERE